MTYYKPATLSLALSCIKLFDIDNTVTMKSWLEVTQGLGRGSYSYSIATMGAFLAISTQNMNMTDTQPLHDSKSRVARVQSCSKIQSVILLSALNDMFIRRPAAIHPCNQPANHQQHEVLCESQYLCIYITKPNQK